MPKRINGAGLTANQELAMMQKAMSGDIVMVVSPDTTGTSATDNGFTRDVTVSIETAIGEVHGWVNTTIASKVALTMSETAGTGDATIASTSLILVNGVANITITGTGVWAEDETNTLTISAIELCGMSVTGDTSVDTIVA